MSLFKRLGLLILIGISLVGLTSCKKDKYKIVVSEVTHSIFYSPQYVALSKGFFKEEGLSVTLQTAEGADKVMASLISKSAQIGLMGPEASIYVYNGGQKNYAINFAQLTKRDGSFLVGRKPIDDFDFNMLKGKSILGGRKGGVPEMTLEYVLKQKGLEVGQDDPTKEVLVRTDVQFGALAGAFIGGDGDFVTLFEPLATSLELEGKGYVVASIGQESGLIPYTAYSATKSYIEENPDVIQKFTNALYKAQLWIAENDASEIAKAVHQYFIETDLNTLTLVMQRYKDIDAWCVNPILEEASLLKLMEVMELAEELDKRPPYAKIVDNTFAIKAMSKHK